MIPAAFPDCLARSPARCSAADLIAPSGLLEVKTLNNVIGAAGTLAGIALKVDTHYKTQKATEAWTLYNSAVTEGYTGLVTDPMYNNAIEEATISIAV